MTGSNCAVCGRKLTFFNRAGNSGLCNRDYRKKALFYDYFDIYHPTCEAATERHVRDIFIKLIPLLLVFLVIAWLGTAIFGTTASWIFMAAGLFLGYRAGYPAKGHPVDKLRYERFFITFAVMVFLGALIVTLFAPAQIQAVNNIVYARLYPQYMSILPAILVALIVVYLFVKRDERASDNAYSEWQDAHPERMS